MKNNNHFISFAGFLQTTFICLWQMSVCIGVPDAGTSTYEDAHPEPPTSLFLDARIARALFRMIMARSVIPHPDITGTLYPDRLELVCHSFGATLTMHIVVTEFQMIRTWAPALLPDEYSTQMFFLDVFGLLLDRFDNRRTHVLEANTMDPYVYTFPKPLSELSDLWSHRTARDVFLNAHLPYERDEIMADMHRRTFEMMDPHYTPPPVMHRSAQVTDDRIRRSERIVENNRRRRLFSE